MKVSTFDDANKKSHRRLIFCGEGDSNQTKYEVLSNTLKIAVSAGSEVAGKCMHIFLKQLIDGHNSWWFLCHLYGVDKTSNQKTIPQIVEIFTRKACENYFRGQGSKILAVASLCDTYGKIHDIQKDGIYVEGKLRSYSTEKHIKRFVGDVEIWDIFRIGSALGIWSDTDQHQ